MAQIFISGMTPIEVWSVINEIAPFDWKYIDVYIDNSILVFVSSNMVTRVCDALITAGNENLELYTVYVA